MYVLTCIWNAKITASTPKKMRLWKFCCAFIKMGEHETHLRCLCVRVCLYAGSVRTPSLNTKHSCLKLVQLLCVISHQHTNAYKIRTKHSVYLLIVKHWVLLCGIAQHLHSIPYSIVQVFKMLNTFPRLFAFMPNLI